MTGFLLDTNCVSEAARRQPEPRVRKWMEAADEDLLYLSVLTLGEIRKGIASLPQGTRRTQLETWLEIDLRPRFAGRILPVDEPIADRWGTLAEEAGRRGKVLSVIDALLAATAQHYNLTIVSRNVSHFTAVQVPIVNPWEA